MIESMYSLDDLEVVPSGDELALVGACPPLIEAWRRQITEQGLGLHDLAHGLTLARGFFGHFGRAVVADERVQRGRDRRVLLEQIPAARLVRFDS